jgi:hypothetical protein
VISITSVTPKAAYTDSGQLRMMIMFDTKRLLAIAGIILLASVADIAVRNWHHCGGSNHIEACYKHWPAFHVKAILPASWKAS